jgi:spermidine synthase
MNPPPGYRGSDSPVFLLFLVVTSVLCGGLVMVIEVLGSKVVGPFFGVSLFVWTSLITVTLVALALGYAAGGLLSDRKSDPVYLYGIILVAGFLVLLIPHLKPSVLKACMSLGLRTGSLVSATLLFGPSLFLLGCVSPYIVRIAAREMTNIGRTVGLFYAVSTIGSFLGTVLTGFVLIAYFRVDRIFEFVGLSLICLSVAYFTVFRKRLGFLGLLILPCFMFRMPGLREKIQANGTKVAEVFVADSFYGNLKVLDYSYGDRHIRELAIDGLIQSGVDMANGLSAYEYPYLMQFLPYGINPAGKNCLVLGLGAGVIPMWYEARGIRTDVVDINPAIADVAGKFFGFRISGDVIISDARYHLATSDKKYDYIIVDVAGGDWAPSHVMSLEAFRLLHERLAKKGIVAINLVGSLQREPFMTASIVGTLAQVFGTVKAYPNLDPAGGADPQNIALIAYDDGSLSFDPQRVKDFPVHHLVEPLIGAVLGKEFSFPDRTPAITLSDDYNPIDFFDLRVKEATRRGLLSYTDWDLLI